MREIEFRGKSLLTNKWEYGWIVKTVMPEQYHIIGTIRDYGDYVKVVKETVGQYTGLKDKNGINIFEGDIVKADKNIYSVSYQENCAEFMFCNNEEDMCILNFFNVEVIGNIYDNPELLEVKQ